MKFQYVFGNPTGSKKKARRSKVAKKKKAKKNPQKYKLTARDKKTRKKIQSKTTKWHPTRSEVNKLQTEVLKLKEKKKAAKSRDAKKLLAAKIKIADDKYKTAKTLHKKANKGRKQLKSDARTGGFTVSEDYVYAPVPKRKKKKKTKKKGTKAMAKRKVKRKSASKKKSTTKRKKRKTTRKASAKKTSTKRKSTKRKSTKRKSTRKASTRKKSTRRKRAKKAKVQIKVTGRKGRSKSITLKNPKRRKRRNPTVKNLLKRGNPMKVGGFKVAGYDAMELAELGAGGLFYGAANSYITPMFQKIPGLGQYASALGGTLPSLVTGILLNIIADKVNNRQVKQAASFLGDGILGAAVVGAGVHFSQGLLGGGQMSGVDYIPQLPGAQSDFGGVDYTPEMAGVDYTAEMAGVDFTAGRSLPGHNQGADFGEYEESAADFGVVPTGLI